jgi:hypothetical protein
MGRRRLIIDCEQLALAWINGRSRRSFQDRAVWYRFPAAMSHRLPLTRKISDGVNSRCEASGLPTQSARLFRGSLDSRLSRHSRLLAEAPSLTNFPVQFCGGALQNPLSALHHLALTSHVARRVRFN